MITGAAAFPTTRRTSAVVPVPSGSSPCQQAIEAIWPAASRDQALIIQHREDGSGDPTRTHLNTNGTTDIGCMQLNTVHLGRAGWTAFSQAQDAAWNVRYALMIWQAQGWCPWTTARGLYC